MRPEPAGLGPEYASQFADASIVANYAFRLPYPDEVFEVLSDLVGDNPRVVLDLGCGTGDIARQLAPLVQRVDAVDAAAPMIARGRTLPGGDDARIRWVVGLAEDAPLAPVYGLTVAGESLHWMDWQRLLPRLRQVLLPGAFLALAGRHDAHLPWRAELQALVPRYTTNHDYVPYDLVDELTSRGMFREVGRHVTAPVRHMQHVEDYIRGFHSRNGFSLDRMPPEAAVEFDQLLRQLLACYARHDYVPVEVIAQVVWGYP